MTNEVDRRVRAVVDGRTGENGRAAFLVDPGPIIRELISSGRAAATWRHLRRLAGGSSRGAAAAPLCPRESSP